MEPTTAALALPVVAVGCLAWFLAVLVSLPQRSRGLYWGALAVALLSLPAAAAIMLVQPSSAICPDGGIHRRGQRDVDAADGLGRAGAATRMAPGCWWGWRRLAGFASFPLARAVGLIPASFWTAHGTLIGIAVELPLSSCRPWC